MKRHKYSQIWKPFTGAFLALTMIITPHVTVFAEEAQTPKEPEQIVSDPMPLTTHESFDYVGETRQAPTAQAVLLPDHYDLRDTNGDGLDVGDDCYVTPVKLQNPFGTCWAFASIAAAETSILSSGLAESSGLDKSTLDLSEKHLSYFITTSITDKNNPQYGEGYTAKTSISERMNLGGFPFLATSFYASGCGPLLESAWDPADGAFNRLTYRGVKGTVDYRVVDGEYIPFSYNGDDDEDWTVPENYRSRQSFSLKESYIIPSPVEVTGNNLLNWKVTINPEKLFAIKKQIYEGRGMQIGFLADQSKPDDAIDPDDPTASLNTETWAQYGTVAKFANHAVTIIGWDDNYPKENFRSVKQPPKNGAWLVKNSWGSGEEVFPNKGNGQWGIKNEGGVNTGYFWLSYYDNSYDLPEAMLFEKTDPSEVLLAHDYMPACTLNATDYETETKFANIFYAKDMEVLKKIAFYTSHPNTSVSYQIYQMTHDLAAPDQGNLIAQGDLGTIEWGGFHKIDLDKEIPLVKGQTFSIILTQKVGDKYTVNVPVSYDPDAYTAVINEHESMLYADDEWLDLSDKEVQKKLTYDEDFETEGAISAEEDKPITICDNFGIKAYVFKQDLDFGAALSGDGNLTYGTKSEKLNLKIDAKKLSDPDRVGELNYAWRLENAEEEGSTPAKELVTLTSSSEKGLTATLQAIKDGTYKTGDFTLAIDVKVGDVPYGTIRRNLSVIRSSIEGIQLNDVDEEGNDMVYTYTGEEIKPVQISVTAYGNFTLREGKDYDLTFKNNTLCGVASVTAATTKDSDFEESSAKSFYAIKPAKAELKKVAAGEGTLTVTVADQKASGLTGYQVNFRKVGETKWASRKFPADKPVFTLTGIEGGSCYEVQVCGYLEIKNTEDYYNMVEPFYAGEPSETLQSAKVKPAPPAPKPAPQIKRAVITKLVSGRKKLAVYVMDQKATGIKGYRIFYRVKGTTKWKSKLLKAGKTKLVLKKLKSGRKYQVCVCGFAKVSGKIKYGKPSKVKTSRKIK